MPNMQRLKGEGIWFENFFANSFRTDRGEVAILSGFPAQTRMSIMKLPAKSRNLPSLARSLPARVCHLLLLWRRPELHQPGFVHVRYGLAAAHVAERPALRYPAGRLGAMTTR